MSDPVMSPDGKFMWSGSEWIPAPPSEALESKQSILMQDSVISGDVVHHTVHNDSETISAAVVAALDRIGLVKGAPPGAMTEEQQQQLEEVNEMVDSAEAEGLNLSPDTWWKLVEAAIWNFDVDLARTHLDSMEMSAEELGDVLNERKARLQRKLMLLWEAVMDEDNENKVPWKFESYVQETLELARQHGSRGLEVLALGALREIVEVRGDFQQGIQLLKQALAIEYEMEKWDHVSGTYGCMQNTYMELGQYDEAEACFEAGLQVIRDHEVDAIFELMLYVSKIKLLKKSRKNGWLGRISKEGKAEILDYVNLVWKLGHEKGFDNSMMSDLLER